MVVDLAAHQMLNRLIESYVLQCVGSSTERLSIVERSCGSSSKQRLHVLHLQSWPELR